MLGLLTNKWVAGALGIGLLFGSFYYMHDTIQDQKLEINKLSENIATQTRMADELRANISELQTQEQSFSKRIGELNTKLDTKISGLEKMIGRSDVVAKKPKLVEKKINASYEGFTKDADCIMGGKKCK
ncbi:PseT.3 conserved hypothetical membrane-like protein [Aeromonas phage phiAS5]|uniref:PseT.3 conserved hypothetical membrane-like protein n=1 Tax=Aeromonas phage phiAS5 TaxID=879630 RepID=E1A2G5_9CAUD|nr:Rz-like spanin [Aeromonas phage phiAS5]ADM79911.1 PseT.3 conserved hypothetical membrane-like protein [Aeromonas phage phiAS5]BES53319.1 hypothetical protein [Aeromonas phage phiWae14]